MEGRSIPELVTSALGVEQFADATRQSRYLEQGYNSLDRNEVERRFAHGAALRGLARVKHRHRPGYQTEPWLPDEQQLEMVQSELAPVAQRLRIINAVEQYVHGAGYETNEHTLREHQTEVFRKLADFMRSGPRTPEGGKRGYIKMPTGTGKTVVFAKLIEAINQSDQPVKSLVLVPSKDILAQTVGKNKKRGFGKFADKLRVTSYYSDEKDLSGDTVVMTYQSFNLAMEAGLLSKNFCDVVIFDEAHHTLGPLTKKNVLEFSKDKVAIGLTATPEYGANKKVSEIFDTCIHELDLREAIESGILAPVQCWLYKTDFKVDLDPREKKRFTPMELHRLAELEARNRVAVKLAKEFVEQGLQGLISCVPGEDVVHPIIIAEMLEGVMVNDPKRGRRPIVVEALSGKMGGEERRNVYERFEKGEIDVLAYVDLIGEGWDSDAAKFLINLRPTCSPVFNIQRLGRILRQTDDNQIAYVVDFLDITNKAQHTALHALGEYRYHPEKVYGSYYEKAEGHGIRIELPDSLKQKIYAVRARKVREIIVNPNYKPTHSELLTITSLGERFKVPHDVIYHIARYLGIEMTKKVWQDGKQKLFIEDRHVEMIQHQLRSSRFAFIARGNTTLQQRRAFFDEMFAKVPKEKRAPNVKELFVSGVSDGQGDPVENENPDITIESGPAEQKKQPAGKQAFTLSEMQQLLLGAEQPSKEVLESLMHGVAGNPEVAITLLAYNAQNKPKAKPVITFESARVGFTCWVRVDDHNGQSYEVSASAGSKKKSQQLASVKLLAAMSDVVLSVQDTLDYSEIDELQQAAIIQNGADNPRSQLNSYSQTMETPLHFETKRVRVIGEFQIFESTASITVKGQELMASGRGLSKKAAEISASNTLLPLLPQARPKPKKKEPVKEVPAAPVNRNFIYKGKEYRIPTDPAVVPHQWEQITGESVDVQYIQPASGPGFSCIITRTTSLGEKITTHGPIKGSKASAKRAAAAVFAASIGGTVTD